MFFLAVAVANLASVVPLVLDPTALPGAGEVAPLTVIVLLLATPAAFLAVVVLFVIGPRALAGAALTDGSRTAWNVLRGVVLGAGSWLVATGLSALLSWLVTAITGEEPTDGQVVIDMARSIPPVLAVALIGIAAPMSEELFFRWVAVNAWAREKGVRVAVIGSAVLFGAAHLLGGSVLALPPIFLLGLILGAAYVTTRSLPLVMGMHAAFNCLSLGLLYLAPV
jgi:membrane protease YdiL (CAAX protease family)